MHPAIDASLRGNASALTASDYRFYGRFMLLFGVAGVGVGLCLLCVNWATLQHLLHGPVSITHRQLRLAESLKTLPSPWVSIAMSRVIDTGVRRTGMRRSTEFHYLLIPVEDRHLLVEVEADFKPGTRINGYLEEWASDRHGGILKDVQTVGRADRLLPFQMCAVGDGGGQQQFTVALGPTVVLVSLVFAGIGWRSLSHHSPRDGPWKVPV